MQWVNKGNSWHQIPGSASLRPGKFLMGTGVFLILSGLYWCWQVTPAIVLGGGQDLGRVNGDDPPTVRVGLVNLHAGPVVVQSAKVGCSLDDLQVQARPFAPAWFELPLNLNGLPTGRREIALTVRGFQNGAPIAIPTFVSAEVYRDVR